MSNRRSIWVTLAAVHLTLVLCGACSWLPDRNSSPAAQVICWYATMSAANSEYAFFAPDVGAPHRARFLLEDDNRAEWWDTFDRASTSEARLRLTGIVESSFMTGATERWPKWRKHLVSSWAATMFMRHETAVSQTVVVEAYIVPTMAEYRSGKRPSWQEVYRAEFGRQPTTTVSQTGSDLR